MSDYFSRRKVSQERVMGISFVDVLMQVIFVLLVVLMVGYIDPEEQDELNKYSKLGQDLCVKVNKDNFEACRDYLKDETVGVKSEFDSVGADACKKLGASNRDDCFEKINKLIGSLNTCLPTVRKNFVPPSTIWEILSPDEIRFVKFTDDYKNYISSKGMAEKVEIVNLLGLKAGRVYRPSEIPAVFGFLKEGTCYHSYSQTVIGRFSSKEIAAATAALWRLREFSID
jgi:hypothetical protein